MTTTTKPERFAMPAVVELLGHKKLAGLVSEETVAGAALLRIDVPKTAARDAYTKFFGVGSIYCLTPVSEDLMQRAAEVIERYSEPIPVHLPEPAKQLPAGAASADEQYVAGDIGEDGDVDDWRDREDDDDVDD